MEQMAALFAEWSGQLAATIEAAQLLAWKLRTREDSSSEARELYSRLEYARLELESLRQVAVPQNDKANEDWLKKLGWSSSPTDEED